MSDRNRRMVLAERPSGMVDEQTVRLEEDDAPEPGAGEALAQGALPLDRPDDPHLDGRRARATCRRSGSARWCAAAASPR